MLNKRRLDSCHIQGGVNVLADIFFLKELLQLFLGGRSPSRGDLLYTIKDQFTFLGAAIFFYRSLLMLLVIVELAVLLPNAFISIVQTLNFMLILKVIEHKPYDHKADVFSFGVVLWELLTAKVRYDAAAAPL